MDRPDRVRPGEELDVPVLRAYLEERLPDLGGDLEVLQFPAGYSNLTYLLRVGDRELVLRRPPFGSEVATAHDMGREFRVLSALAPVWPKAPRPLLHCDDPGVLGAPFYVMERVRGVVLRSRPPAGVELTPAVLAGLSGSFVETLAELHGLDYRAAGLEDLGRPEGYVARQVHGWIRRYRAARTDDVPEVEETAAWLAENLPPEDPSGARAGLLHNDFKYDNLVLAPDDLTRVLAVLDWEMATVGDPWMDLGSSLAYWIDPEDPDELRSPAVPHLTALPGNLRRSELVARYVDLTGREPVADPVFYFAYGQLKLAGIVQQIYFRFRQGHTADRRFAGLGALVRACGRAARLAIETGRIDRLTAS